MAPGGITHVWRSPLARLALYYVLLFSVIALVVRNFPALLSDLALAQPQLAQGLADFRSTLGGSDPAQEGAASFLGRPGMARATALAMLGALLLVIPVAWVYMITKQRQGYDQSVVQTVIVLPLAVAGVVMVVQRDLALAFALAAIVAAVRFRNTLKDTKDAVYIFVAMGVGLAAGVQALNVAFVISVFFSAVVLVLWRFNVGNIYADQRSRTAPLKLSEALAGPGAGGEALSIGDPALLAALTPDDLSEVAERAARLRQYIDARARAKKKPFSGVLLVHTAQLEPAQRMVEAVLEEEAKRWRLAEIMRGEGEHSTLEYLVRLKKERLPAAVLDALKSRGAPHVVGAEFRSLKGLKKNA